MRFAENCSAHLFVRFLFVSLNQSPPPLVARPCTHAEYVRASDDLAANIIAQSKPNEPGIGVMMGVPGDPVRISCGDSYFDVGLLAADAEVLAVGGQTVRIDPTLECVQTLGSMLYMFLDPRCVVPEVSRCAIRALSGITR